MAVTNYQFLTELGIQKLADALIKKSNAQFNKQIVQNITAGSSETEVASAKALYDLLQTIDNRINTTNQNVTNINNSTTSIETESAAMQTDITRIKQELTNMSRLSITTVTGNIATEVTNPDSSVLYFQRDNTADTTWELYIYDADHNWIDIGSTEVDLSNYWQKSDTAAMKASLGITNITTSPAFTGTPTAPTPPAGDNSTKIATTEFVNNAVAGKQNTITGAASTITTSNLTASRVVISNTSGKLATSAVTATEVGYVGGVTSAIQTQLNAKAPLSSPAFAGSPTAPTVAVGDNSTKIATTAFVNGAIASNKPKSGTISLSSTGWVASGTNFRQTVTISGLTANHKVDLQPTPTVVTQLITDNCSGLIPVNTNGVFSVTAIGAKPTATLSVPYTMILV